MPSMRVDSPFFSQDASLLTAPVAFFLGLALVVLFLSLGEGDFYTSDSLAVEIEFRRDDCIALFCDCASELVNLAAVEQKAAVALGGMLKMRASGGVFGDMAVY